MQRAQQSILDKDDRCGHGGVDDEDDLDAEGMKVGYVWEFGA